MRYLLIILLCLGLCGCGELPENYSGDDKTYLFKQDGKYYRMWVREKRGDIWIIRGDFDMEYRDTYINIKENTKIYTYDGELVK